MRRFLKPLLLAGLSLMARPLAAQELSVQMLGATSIGSGLRCDRNSVQMSAAGNDLSLVFSGMNASMPGGENPRLKSLWGSCIVALNVSIPKGFTIAALQSQLQGGVVKDLGASGYVDMVTTFTQRRMIPMNPYAPIIPFGPMIHLQRIFAVNEFIDEPLFDLSKSAPVGPAAKKSICALTAQKSTNLNMYVRLTVAATRQKTNLTNIINIDSLDNHLDLSMNTEECPRRRY